MDAVSFVPPWWLRTAAYLLVVGMFAFAIWRVEQVRLDDRAQQCVAAWTVRAQSRDMAEKVYRTNASTLIELAGGANPQRLALYRVKVERDVKVIRATLPDPACDLAAAKRRIR
jgi:hypothetical protein